ncbi:MAG TPA: hypothetical protein DDW51_05660 [Cyanobacteria bacterium UBA11367]|nr:hypothetical protein [Cyanobacteria bacterium UBA11367]HBE56770.1 hypothetical protein [Cyanobacteria bacterium UBA11366]HCA95975.1 hypothetical protein [Cyanobacteria bacterium UBA9226]
MIFGGIECRVLSRSSHGNYIMIEFSDRIQICGTFCNQWEWEWNYEEDSGFLSFITYIGLRSRSEYREIYYLISNLGGYCKEDESFRKSKHCLQPYEMKVRNLSITALHQLREEIE